MRTTLTINDKLYKAVKMRALESDESVSSYIEYALKAQLLEDHQDIADIEKRKNEPTMSHEEFMKELRSEGLL
jgi:hypothetical protein